MSTTPMFEEFRKAQEILAQTVEKTARANLASVEKMMELNRTGFAGMQEAEGPADFIARQSGVLRQYGEEFGRQFEELSAIGTESREQLLELGQAMIRNVDLSGWFDLAPTAAAGKTKSKPSSKAA